MRQTFDIQKQFEEIKASAVSAVNSIFPVSGSQRSIIAEKVWVEDKSPIDDYSGQSKTKANNGTWGVPVYASLVLKDKTTGQIIDRSPRTRLFLLPKHTARASYIVNGNEYQVQSQLRLKPGVYTLRKQNGELKTSVNLAAGRNFDLIFEERTGLFKIAKIGGGQANIPLYPILTHLGLSAAAIARAWGEGLAFANSKQDPKAVARAEAAFNAKQGLSQYFSNTKLSGETTQITLGKSFERVDGPMLLAAAKKLLDVHMGREEPEDRDSLTFKELHSLEDFIKERIEKNKGSLSYKIERALNNPKRDKISQIVNPSTFSTTVESFFTQDDKSSTPEQTNPLEMLSGQFRTTITGSGGITSRHAITDDMRNIHPSHYGFIDPVHTPESDKVGANLHLPLGVVKDGKDMKTLLIDAKTGKTALLTPAQAYNAKIAFPGQPKTGEVKANYQGKIVLIPAREVQYWTPSSRGLFSWSTNLIPFLPSDQGNRAMMGAKMMEQAISLKNREAPLVQVDKGDGESIEKHIGTGIAVVFDPKKELGEGTVKKITADKITVSTKRGMVEYPLYNNFTLNRKSFMHHEPRVSVGQKVKSGDVIADSNFTKGGVLALGVNLRTAYIPYKGYNFEDGIVITESAAKKLTSEHIYKKSIDIDENIINNLTTFRTQYPNAIQPNNLKKLDQDGVIKKGEKVNYGDVVIAALQKRQPSAMIGAIQRQLADRPKDISINWTLEDEGTVLDVQRTRSGITVLIKTEEQAKIGDKLAGRHGNKGIITKIIADNEAPRSKDGNPVDILLNPHGVISRINIGQIYESASSKIADKTKKPHVVNNFSGENYLDTTKKLLDKAKVDDEEELIDPETNKSLGKVHVGNPYILKLYKQSTSNFSVRQGGPGNPYDQNQQPLKTGGEEGTKAMDLLSIYSLLSHGARANLREMSWLKANQNDEFWKALKSGQQLPPPKAPYVFDKFTGYLKGAGIDIKKNGTKQVLAPLTDEEVKKLSNGEVKEPVFYRAKDMEPMKDGFYDPVKFGGLKGQKWGHIELKEAVVNPVFENAVRKVTGLGTKFDDIVAGRVHVDASGKLNSEGKGVTGGAAIEKLLKQVDIDKDIKALEKKALTSRGQSLDDINKHLRYLYALKKSGLNPHEAYMRKLVPVVPPQFRPIYKLPSGDTQNSDLNFLYQNVGVLNKMQQLPVMELLPDEEKSDIRKDIYEHMKALTGLKGANVIKGRVRDGFISEIKGGADGGQPKEGFFIGKMLSKRQDYVGRGTIIPEPSLGVDEMAMPEQMAWKIFEPFIVRELSKFGKSPNQAAEEIKQKTELAKRALDIVMKERLVLLNRAPSLHKFSVMAFKPTITQGKSVKIPPLVVKGFNADFDGDTMTVHTPVTDEAVQEAHRLLPSRNLYSPGDHSKLMLAPGQEAQLGLYYLSLTAQGRTRLAKILGPKFPVNAVLDKKGVSNLLQKISVEAPKDFPRILQDLKQEGDKHAYEKGFSIGINDLAVFKKERDRIVSTAERLAKTSTLEQLEKHNATLTGIVNKLLDKKLAGKENPLYDMVRSGARGSADQLRQIMVSPLFLADAKGKIVPIPIRKSYSEGLDVADYWTSLYGARRGMMDRAIQTSIPGGFAKDIMASTIDNVISAQDCGTKKGVMFHVEHADLLDRFLAGAQFGFAHNTLVDTNVVMKLKKAGAKEVMARSPLTCLQAKGTCAKCYGLDEHGQTPEVGDNVGAKAGQTLSEPLTQMTMNCSVGNIVDSKGRAQAFEDFYDAVGADESFDGHCYTKHAFFDVIDSGEVVPSGIIQNHPADDTMLFIKTKTGHSALVQANHPMWVYDETGAEREIFAGDIKKGDRLKIDRSVPSGSESAPFDPYWIGLFLAEGCTRYGNGTERYKDKAVATILTQHDNEIKERAFSRVASVKGAKKNKLDIQIYNPDFATTMAQIVRGREAKVKRLMPGFNLWSKEDLIKLVAGWIDGDGTVTDQHGYPVAKVYTSSYVALQQLEIICSKLDARFTPYVVSQRPEQKTPQFVADIRFKDDAIWAHSVKLARVPFKKSDYEIKREELEPVTYIKPLWKWDLPVWDIKTETRGFTCGMVRNHNTFHTGGIAGTGIQATGMKRIDQLLKLPKIVASAAALAPKRGKVQSIVPGVGGGYDVTVAGAVAHVSQGLKLKVKVGDEVEAGDPLSEGVIKPQDLVQHKGMLPAQKYIVDELQKAYSGQGAKVQKKIFETVVRSLGNTTVVQNKPQGTGYLPGDIIPYTVAQHHNENLNREVPINEALGHKLAKQYGPFKAGTEVDAKIEDILTKAGIGQVQIQMDPIDHAPTLRNINTLPMLKKNWMSALGYRRLADALKEGASQGWETDIEDYHPVPAFAHGATFGKGKGGKY